MISQLFFDTTTTLYPMEYCCDPLPVDTKSLARLTRSPCRHIIVFACQFDTIICMSLTKKNARSPHLLADLGTRTNSLFFGLKYNLYVRECSTMMCWGDKNQGGAPIFVTPIRGGGWCSDFCHV